MEYSIIDDRGELRGVNNFLLHHAKEAKNCLPPPMLDIFSVAEENGELVAVCGASIASQDKLHVEKIYSFDDKVKALMENRAEVCEIGRFFSTHPEATQPVLKSLIGHLLDQGVRYALCDMKKPIIRRTRSLGLKYEPTTSVLLLGAIDPTEKPYYATDPPMLYVLDLSSIEWV